MSLLKVNEVQNYNGSSLTLTASTVSTSAQLNTGGNISVTGSINVSDDSTTRSNLGLGSIATQDSDNVTVTGGTATLGALTVSGSDSGDLVRITQTGSGNALVVEDSANPDSTPFVVDASGNVGIGTNSPATALDVTGTVTADGLIVNNDVEIGVFNATGASTGFATAMTAEPRLHISAGQTTASDFLKFFNGNGQIGRIVCTGSTTTYHTSSDYRLKENITEITDGITRLKQLKPSRFNFIADPNTTVDGFIAHEVQPIIPEAVSGEKDTVNEDGSINPQGIDQSKLVPLLTAALQESIAKIESLETRIAQLESK